jgi:hypothetical protein
MGEWGKERGAKRDKRGRKHLSLTTFEQDRTPQNVQTFKTCNKHAE